MTLQSRLFRGDPKLEAAAVLDSAHVQLGAKGEHVRKIQLALVQLDGAAITADGDYGPATAAAVLAYKRKRNVINRSYQTQADDVVGKMTMAKLDEEMRAHESKPPARVELIPISPQANRDKVYPRVDFRVTAGNAPVAAPAAHVLPTNAINIDPGQEAVIDVKNGNGYDLQITSAHYKYHEHVAVLSVPGISDSVTHCHLNVDSIRIKVKGMKWGTAMLFAQNYKAGPNATEKLIVNVRDPRPKKFTPSVIHNHQPVSEPRGWSKVVLEALQHPEEVILYPFVVAHASPPVVAKAAIIALAPYPMARWHYDYYLNGGGGTVNEDANLKRWIEGDSKVRSTIARKIREMRQGNYSYVHVTFELNRDMMDDMDAYSSYGTIDFFEVAANFATGKVEVWFEDTYEWHPPYSGYSCPDKKKPRGTHFGHAALVQMKLRGAADYQMRGQAEFDMKIFPGL